MLEGLDLSEVAPGDYYLFAAPVKLGGLEGATRACGAYQRLYFLGQPLTLCRICNK